MPKPGRPKEKSRKHMHIMVLASTDKAIRSSIIRGDKGMNTAGKVVDEAMKGRR